jgi:hypothetical protein
VEVKKQSGTMSTKCMSPDIVPENQNYRNGMAGACHIYTKNDNTKLEG